MGTNEINKKENKTIKFIILSVLIIAVISLTGFAFARYITSLNGQTQVQIAQWNFKVTAGGSQNLSINLADTRLANDTTEVDRTTVAPGTKGALVLNIDATGNQVSLEYDIDLSLTQVPENLIFYSDAEMTNAFLKENGAIHLDGYFLANAENKTASKTIYWQWPIETGSTQTEIDDNDELDSNWIGSDVILGIAATGKQIMGNPDEEYTVTFDLNGGTLANHGDSTQVTKQVAYGEAYGELPVPTREGYTFKGWNGKNLFELKDTADFVNANTIYNVNKEENSVTVGGDKTWELIEYYLPTLKANTTYSISGHIELINLDKSFLRISEDRGIINNNHFILNRTFLQQTEEFNSVFTTGNEFPNSLALLLFGNWGREITVEGGKVKISNLMIEENTTATEYEPYYVTDITPVTQNKNHTLTAIWEPVSNP